MCVIRAIRLLAALSVATLLFYILLGHRQFHGEPRHPLGAMRPVFLLANLITFMTLVALCCIGSDKLKSIPTTRAAVIAICVANGVFLLIFFGGLFLFFFP